MEVEISFFFILASSTLTAVNIYLKDNFGAGSRAQIITAPPAPAPQHCFSLFSVTVVKGHGWPHILGNEGNK